MLRFSVGVYIFSVIMMINTVNDLADIISMDYFKNDKDNSFAIFFYIKLVSDVFIILGILFAVFSACSQKYTPSVIAYYLVLISFLLNTTFCIFILFQIGNSDFIVSLMTSVKSSFVKIARKPLQLISAGFARAKST